MGTEPTRRAYSESARRKGLALCLDDEISFLNGRYSLYLKDGVGEWLSVEIGRDHLQPLHAVEKACGSGGGDHERRALWLRQLHFIPALDILRDGPSPLRIST